MWCSSMPSSMCSTWFPSCARGGWPGRRGRAPCSSFPRARRRPGASVPGTSSCSTRSEATMAAEHVMSAAAVGDAPRPLDQPSKAWSVSPTVVGIAGVVAVATVLRLGLTPYGIMAGGSLGVLLGLGAIPALMLGILATAPVLAVMFVLRGREARRTAIPLGPFLALGAAIVVLTGAA